jgi:hypothetical protein
MHELPEDTRKYYVENPEGLALRKQLGIEYIEDYIIQFGLQELNKYVLEEYDKLWKFAESYWVFPDEEDYKKLVDNLYKKYVKKNN